MNRSLFISLAVLVCLTIQTGNGIALQDAAVPNPLEVEKGYLLSGSGKWRAPNPDYEPGGQQPKQFGINYRWGPHKKHIIGEIIGVVDEEKGKAVYASVYIMYNPVTEDIDVNLVGWDGAYGPAKERRIDDKNRIVEALLFQPNGVVKANRHTYELIDENTYIIRVLEPNDEGTWTRVREETWRQLPEK